MLQLFYTVADNTGVFIPLFLFISLFSVILPALLIYIFHTGDFKEKNHMNLRGTLPFGIIAGAAIAVSAAFFYTLDDTSIVTIESDKYLLEDTSAMVTEIHPMRNPQDPSNHDSATSAIVLEDGVELIEQGYTSIKAGQTIDYQVYREVKLRAFTPSELLDTIDFVYEVGEE